MKLKRLATYALACSFAFAGFIGQASAAQNVANTSQKGSLLIFPKIEIGDLRGDNDDYNTGNNGNWHGGDGTVVSDTIIQISNDYKSGVEVKCIWMNEVQRVSDAEFNLGANQTLWFTAHGLARVANINGMIQEDDRDVTKGELKCFAQSGGEPISFNHLYGSAVVVDYEAGTTFEYNSWNFTARGVALGKSVGKPGLLKLTGNNGDYDACPQYLTTEMVAFQPGAGTELTLVPCKQDMTQIDDESRTNTITLASFEIWNENGGKFTTSWRCINSFFEKWLGDPLNKWTVLDPFTQAPIAGDGNKNFTRTALGTDLARLRIKTYKSQSCETPYYDAWYPGLIGDPNNPVTYLQHNFYDIEAGMGPVGSSQCTPLLGVLIKKYDGLQRWFAQDLDFDRTTGKTPNTAGYDPTGYIKYDASDSVIPESVKK